MNDAFTKLAEWVAQSWDYVRPWTLVEPYEGGIIIRWGKYSRTIGPGLHWKWPIAEMEKTTTTVVTTLNMPAQTLTTSDGVVVVVSCIVKYEVKDPKPYFCDIWDAHDVLRDVTMGAIKQTVMTHDHKGLMSDDIEAAILKTVRAEVNQYGFKVHRVTCTDLAQVQSFRVIGLENFKEHQ